MLVTNINAAGVPGTYYQSGGNAPTDWRTVLADQVRLWGDVVRQRIASPTSRPVLTLPAPAPVIYSTHDPNGQTTTGFGFNTTALLVLAVGAVLLLRK
jgi:hypothetical protein